MISPDILDFLRKLKKNNNREWFDANKDFYRKVKNEFDDFVLRLIHIVKGIDPDIGFPDVKDCTFRIYRDIRFSHDKSPYKTNFGAYINRGGKNAKWAGYYFHIEPGDIFLSGGIYMPEPPVLKALREAIFEEAEVFKQIIHDPVFQKYFPELHGEKLKSIPKGFPKDFPDAELLKFKSYFVMRNVSESMMYAADFENEIIETYSVLKKLNDFMNKAIGQ
jgi:uncharacterized protein (TIGR02453 family)